MLCAVNANGQKTLEREDHKFVRCMLGTFLDGIGWEHFRSHDEKSQLNPFRPGLLKSK
jgi:hypothetical protein